MAVSKKQRELDELKWYKSIELSADACGTFDYCVKCDKNKENPCEVAYNELNKPEKKVAKKSTATKDKKTTKTSTTKKATTKKTTAKKTTTKKTTK